MVLRFVVRFTSSTLMSKMIFQHQGLHAHQVHSILPFKGYIKPLGLPRTCHHQGAIIPHARVSCTPYHQRFLQGSRVGSKGTIIFIGHHILHQAIECHVHNIFTPPLKVQGPTNRHLWGCQIFLIP